MSETRRIIGAVVQLWPEGPALFGARWEEVEQQLLRKLWHLNRHPTEDKTTVDEILVIFELYPEANERLVTLLPLNEMFKGTYKPLPGRQDAIPVSRFECPEEGCSFDWFRRGAQQPPKCPQHHLPLVPADAD